VANQMTAALVHLRNALRPQRDATPVRADGRAGLIGRLRAQRRSAGAG
jgi:hypothetical protein